MTKKTPSDTVKVPNQKIVKQTNLMLNFFLLPLLLFLLLLLETKLCGSFTMVFMHNEKRFCILNCLMYRPYLVSLLLPFLLSLTACYTFSHVYVAFF